MALLLFVTFFVTAALASETAQDLTSAEACAAASGAGSECAALPVDGRVAGVSLLQTRSSLRTRVDGGQSSSDLDLEEPTDVSLLEVDESDFLERAIAAEWKFEEKLPAIIAGSVAAITEATPYFEKKLPDDDEKPDPAAIIQGISVLAKHLFNVFHTGFIEIVEKETPGFDWDEFQANWMETFENIPRDVQKVDELLKLFSEEGKTHALIEAIGAILTKAMHRVHSFLPPKVKKDVDEYFKIITRTVRSIGKSWAAFESGDGAKGAEAMYLGIKGNVDALLPKDLQNDETYKLIMGTVDKQMAKLSQVVMKFKKKMTESRVCIKKSKSRKHKRPRLCPKGMILQGKLCKERQAFASAALALLGLSSEHHHKHHHHKHHEHEESEDDEDSDPETADQEEAQASPQKEFTVALQERAAEATRTQTSDFDESLTGKKDEDKIYPECDEDSAYPDLHKGKCYKACPEGYIGAGRICSEMCESPFPVGEGDWCGKSKTAIGQAKMQIAISAVNAAASIAITIATAVEGGKDKNAKPALDLSSTIDSLTDAAVSFVFPDCSF